MDKLTDAEVGTLVRELYIDAEPDIVFDVVSSPEYVEQWWPDEARYRLEPGSPGELVFRTAEGDEIVQQFSVVESNPPRTFSFRWTHQAGEGPAAGNSLLVTFALTASGSGTTLTMTETGFRERGWEEAELERQFREHVDGWNFFLPRLVTYVAGMEAAS
ncbi:MULTISPECIES: SRPBCC domain-containing protein [Gordonia]|uniref:SRPBCC domain-containing protein n=1 Tax=Gordonia TaxID=2053 RepID=UPI0007E9AAAA|nr:MULTISPECIES: SRPBCC domain-containing protein [Gordonia]MCM3896078.1 SRPBCC domain-containing protein [Gordonia sputi]OBA68303.1 polyketide cyclase [Gordonia sp. 852002-10350_SCH5691597]